MQIDAIITKGSEKCNAIAIADYSVGNPKVVVILQQQQDDDDLEIGSEVGYIVVVPNALYWPFLASLFLLHKCYQRIDAIADLLKALIDHSCLCTVS